MVTDSMTIHAALREIKTLEKRILEKMNDIDACKVTRKRESKAVVETWKENQKSNYDSVTTLIKRRMAIKQAISESNAKTYVTIPAYSETPITVAAAIDLQRQGAFFEDEISEKLKKCYLSANAVYASELSKIERDADAHVQSIYGGQKENNVSSEEVAAAKNNYISDAGLALLDPLNALKTATEINERNATIRDQIDAKLSESNAVTIIEISY